MCKVLLTLAAAVPAALAGGVPAGPPPGATESVGVSREVDRQVLPDKMPGAGPAANGRGLGPASALVSERGGGFVVTDRRPPIYAPAPTPGETAAAPAVPAGPRPPAAAPPPGDPLPPEAPAVPATLRQVGLTDAQYHAVLTDLVLPNGLALDRDSDRDTVSVAATGLVHHALAVLAARGVGDRALAADQLRRGFDTTLAANPAENRGWLSHFTDAAGTPRRWSEVSTIDTALFYGGVLRGAQVLQLEDLERDVRAAVAGTDVALVLRDGVFLHGFEWDADAAEPRFLPYTWDDTSEGALLYRVFGVPFEPRAHRTDLPLFTYFYPLILFPDWDAPGSARPGGAAWNRSPEAGPYVYAGPDYRSLLAAALRWQRETLGHAGVTAADGPSGYTAFRPTLVSPLMLSSLAPHFAEAADTLRDRNLDATLPAYDLDTGWDAPDRLAIDFASYYLLRAVVIEPGRVAVPLLADAQ